MVRLVFVGPPHSLSLFELSFIFEPCASRLSRDTETHETTMLLLFGSNHKGAAFVLLVQQLLFFTTVVSAKKHPKVKLFVLAGGGNIEGFASIGHLHQLAFDNNNKNEEQSLRKYAHLIDPETGGWKTRDDVFVAYEHRRDEGLLTGPLALAKFGGDASSFGPELQLGHVLGDLYEETVVLVKAGWRKRTLSKDFASPSTGTTGFQWYRLIQTIHNTANNLHELLGNEQYRYANVEMGGVVWWHGYDDLLHDPDYSVETYASNLERFIQDLRTELKQPFLPVVIAELGGQGLNTTDAPELEFREMQQRVVNESFPFSPTLVPTAKYVQTDMPIKDYTFYYGRADTMLEISNDLATALANFDWDKNRDPDNGNWFEQEADVSMGFYKTFFFLHYVFLFVVYGSVAFVIIAVVRDKGDFKRTWSTARSRFQSISGSAGHEQRHVELEMNQIDDDDDDEHHLDEYDQDLSESSIPELRDT